jgi:hypothetical protein
VFYGTIEIVQGAMENERPEYIVFVVKTNVYGEGVVYLPITGSVDCQIDWGDGKSEHFEGSVTHVSHKYESAEPAEYVVRISGSVKSLSSSNIPDHSVIEVKQWGLTGLTSLDSAFSGNRKLVSVATDAAGSFAEVQDCGYMFSGCVSLVSLPDGLFDHCVKTTDFSSLCSGCSSLQYIPVGMFSECKAATSFSSAFSSCSSLKEVPAGLFEGLSNVTSFSSTFGYCSSVASVASDAFEGCTSVTNFSNTFKYCSSLKKVPEGLFDDCRMVKDFSYAFYSCSKLSEIPVSLFDNQRWVTNFQSAFSYCSSLTGESPYTYINGNKVHLYERKDYSDYFIVPNDASCFSSCTKLTDYADIPSSWR